MCVVVSRGISVIMDRRAITGKQIQGIISRVLMGQRESGKIISWGVGGEIM